MKKSDSRTIAAAEALADSLAGFACRFDRLIAAAPEHADVSAPRDPAVTTPGLVRESNGWGSRYVHPIPLTGSRWLAMHQEARAEIARGAIVAFLGDRGPGKTQMAAEIARGGAWPADAAHWDGARARTTRTALYRRAMDVFLDLRDAFKKDSRVSEREIVRQLETPGLLVIDEFQERGGSAWEDRVITSLIDKRYAARRPTLLIANYTREEMSHALSPSVRDRMHENGRSFTFDWPSYRRTR